jgi:hypothetical protein
LVGKDHEEIKNYVDDNKVNFRDIICGDKIWIEIVLDRVQGLILVLTLFDLLDFVTGSTSNNYRLLKYSNKVYSTSRHFVTLAFGGTFLKSELSEMESVVNETFAVVRYCGAKNIERKVM